MSKKYCRVAVLAGPVIATLDVGFGQFATFVERPKVELFGARVHPADPTRSLEGIVCY
jgi:hypothetical protein